MTAVRIIDWIIRIAGLGALVLGLLFWFFEVDLISIHMLFGLIVTLALLILSIMAVSTRGMRSLGAIGIMYALVVPVFGLTQDRLLDNSAHWLIQTAHLLVGIGALALAGFISVRYKRLKLVAARKAAAF
jgi:hypothetical protein